jgi:hypothetical protein
MSTTPIEKPSQPTTGIPSIWPYVPGLLWATVLLGILTWWLYVSDLELAAAIVGGTGVVAAASLGLFLWIAVQWLKARKEPAKLAALDASARPVLALAMFAGAAILLFLAAWLCVVEGLKEFAEVSSMVVMALISAGAGLGLRITPQSPLSRQHIFQWMLTHRKEVAMGLMVLGVLLAGAGIYFLFYKGGLTNFRSNFPGGPEGLCLFVIGGVLLGGGLWNFLSLERPATVDTMRLLTLYAGSLSGFAIAIFTAVRISAWWNRYIVAGMPSWQGEDAWRFWYCIYVECFGLMLLFGSLMLARVDIRVKVTMRRMLYGYNAALTGLLLLVILLVVNIFTFVTFPASIAWTRTMGLHTLSDEAKQTLGDLKDRVTVYVLMQRYSETYNEVNDLLDNCLAVTNKLTVEYVSPDQDAARYRDLASTYPELEKQTKSEFRGSGGYGRGLLVVYGEGTEGAKLPHVFIPDKDLEEADPTGKSIQFKGENALMSAILQLVNKGPRPKIYFTQSEGELMINDMNVPDNRVLHLPGAGDLAEKLRKAGYDVQGLVWEAKPKGFQISDMFSFAKKQPTDDSKVPDDCTVLVIAGPEVAMTKDALKAIDEYMDRDGKIMVLTKAGIMENGQFEDDGMPEFCKKFGAEVKNDFIMRLAQDDPRDALWIQVHMPPASTSKLARTFGDRWFKCAMPRPILPIKGPGKYQTEVILEAPPERNGNQMWIESNGAVLEKPRTYGIYLQRTGKLETMVSKDPVSVGVSITDRENKLRGFIIGDDGFVSTLYRRIEPTQQAVGCDFVRSCLELLVDRKIPDLKITPKESGFFSFAKTEETSMGRLLWLPFGLMLLALGGTGAGIWVVRRK